VTYSSSRFHGRAVASLAVGSILATSVPSVAAAQGPILAYPNGQAPNAYEVAACAASGAIICALASSSASAAKTDTNNRFPNANRDGARGNAFQHSTWNSRMAVVMGSRSLAELFSSAHEKPISSPNPPGTSLANRNERMDLCNNKRGWNRPSNVEILTLNQQSAINKLKDEAIAMSNDAGNAAVLIPTRSCDGTRLVLFKKDDGTVIG